MNAKETKLQSLFEGTKQYIVPLFQRPYSWEEKHWQKLWDDLFELCESNSPRTHFLGSIVRMLTDSLPEGVSKYLLIDGQQRLTTIFILLIFLRDQAKNGFQEQLAEEINNTLLVNPYKKNSSDFYKLQPTQVDQAAFESLINGEASVDGVQIRKAYEFFSRKFRQSGITGQLLKKVISSQLSVVSIQLDADDNPHVIFESLNGTGRPLSQADLIRNYFFMRIHVEEQEMIYAKYWNPMQVALGEDLAEFIRHYLTRFGALVRKSDVYFTLKDRVDQENAIEQLKDLGRFAIYYRKLLKPENENNLHIRRLLNRLNRSEVTTTYPFLLNCYDDYAKDLLSAEEFITVLELLENFLVRRFICRVTTNQLNKIFPSLYAQVKLQAASSGHFVQALRDVLQTKIYPKDLPFSLSLRNARLYGDKNRSNRAKLILESIEESFKHKEQVDFEHFSIEHVMPQKLTVWWADHLGDDQDLHDLLVHTIGNLTLTKYNSELSTGAFGTKKQILSESHLEMNKYFGDKATWQREDIEERSRYMADICLRIWPYFGADQNNLKVYKDDVTGTTPQLLRVLGQTFILKSWSEVLEKTMNTIAELEPDKFELILQQFPRFVGRDKESFRRSRPLQNGTFIETKLAANEIKRFCQQALEYIDLTTDDWEVTAD